MKSRFIEKPDECVIKEIGEHFCLQGAVIAIDSSDIKENLEGAKNAIVLLGKASGNNRCADAIEDAVMHTCSVTDGYNLFSADKVIIYIFSPKDNPMLMSENEAINTFVQMFRPDTQWKWGLEEKKDLQDMKIMIIASNLKPKYQE